MDYTTKAQLLDNLLSTFKVVITNLRMFIHNALVPIDAQEFLDYHLDCRS